MEGKMGQNNPTVIFTEPKKVAIEDRPFPSAGDNGLLVQTTRTLISTGTELTILNGEFPKDSAWASYGKFPFVPGYVAKQGTTVTSANTAAIPMIDHNFIRLFPPPITTQDTVNPHVSSLSKKPARS
jgi:hypothetical protein